MALAWLMARPSITAPIASATNLDQLKDLIAATELKLNEDSIDILNRASAPAPCSGDSVGGRVYDARELCLGVPLSDVRNTEANQPWFS